MLRAASDKAATVDRDRILAGSVLVWQVYGRMGGWMD